MSADDAREPRANIRIPKPGIISVKGEGGRELLAIHPDGTVTGAIEDAGEAARRFVDGLRIQLASRPFTEEDVEAAARSLAETQEGPGRWDMWDEDFREMSGLHLDARAALDAVTARHTKGDNSE